MRGTRPNLCETTGSSRRISGNLFRAVSRKITMVWQIQDADGRYKMRSDFEYVTNLQYKIKALEARLRLFESGEAYCRQRETYEKQLQEKDRIILSLQKELAEAHRETVTVRNNWLQVFEDMEKAAQMEKRALKVEKAWTKLHDKYVQKQKEYYAVLTELEEEKEKNQKLTARLFGIFFRPAFLLSEGRTEENPKQPGEEWKTAGRPAGA